MIWGNINTKVAINVQEEIVTKYLYPQKLTHKTLFAKAFKRLVYHNVYPNIDIELYFPRDSVGLKYNYILRHGADPANIQEKWLGDASIFLDDIKNCIVKSAIGEITLKSPKSFSSANKTVIETNYLVDDNSIGYTFKEKLPDSFIIDPWLVTPIFTNNVNAYDIDYDNLGNTYVYGGGADGSLGFGLPFDLLKYDNTGTLLWSYTASVFLSGWYGDFEIDESSGSIYITNGCMDPGTSSLFDPIAIKLSSSGAFVTQLNPVDAQQNEFCRVNFNKCTNQLLVGGNGIFGNKQMGSIDTNLTLLTNVNLFSTTFVAADMAILASDNYGFCHMIPTLCCSPAASHGYENHLLKCPVPDFFPILYSQPTGYNFQEGASVFLPYFHPGLGITIHGMCYFSGYNGISVSDKTVFTYDGYTLKKWNSTSGTLSISKNINTFYGDRYWSGIAADLCKNVFIASRDTIYQYDSLFVLQNFYLMPDTIYDVQLSELGLLYVTGQGFVKVFEPFGLFTSCSVIIPNLIVVDATCSGQGMASVNPQGGMKPYLISWSTIPTQTGLSATNLSPGDYFVVVSDASCNGNIDTINFSILAGPGTYSTSVNIKNSDCVSGGDGSISLEPVGGIAPYTFVWDTLGFTTSTIDGLGAGEYGVTITDNNGCVNVMNVTVAQTNQHPTISLKDIPNVFSPNSDALNNIFYAFTFIGSTNASQLDYLFEEFSMQVFNRWGHLIFESNDPAKGWDGKDGGNEAPEGVYFVLIKYKYLCSDKPDETIYNGTVQLVR
jgi:gliding motility-associated-like protein